MSDKTEFIAKAMRYYKATAETNDVDGDWVNRTYMFAHGEDRDLFMRDFNESGLFTVFDVTYSSTSNRLYIEFQD